MFRGIANLKVDVKGRIAVPKLHRERLEKNNVSELTVTIDKDKCLLIFPMEAWLDFEQKIMSMPNTNDYSRALQRMYVGYATEIELDSNGRFLIPPALRAYAEIEKNAVMMGQGKKLELWSEHVWEEKSGKYPDLLSDVTFESLTEEIQNLSI